MDEVQNYPDTQEESPDNELSHSDKAVGILTEPGRTFQETAKYPPKTIDWLLPYTILLLVIAVTNIIMMSNENISYEIRQKQMAKFEEQMDDAVNKGRMTREQADQQLDSLEEGMKMSGPTTYVITVVSIFIGGFIMFFIITGIYYLLVKLFFKDDGTYSSALVANGLTSYIVIIQVLAATVLAFIFGRMFKDISLASLMNADTTTFSGWVLAKLDIISIWVYIVFGIGLAKMFKSNTTGKYIVLTFSVWILGSLLFFFLMKNIPFLSFFGG
jgi:hypothetical protein